MPVSASRYQPAMPLFLLSRIGTAILFYLRHTLSRFVAVKCSAMVIARYHLSRTFPWFSPIEAPFIAKTCYVFLNGIEGQREDFLHLV